MKKLSILGSTGSIGVTALNVIASNPEKYRVIALGAGKNIDLLLKQIKTFSKGRKEKVKLRIEENSKEDFLKAIDLIEESDFCKGKNDRNWVADIDWLIANDTNIIKVLEGKYNNKNKSKDSANVITNPNHL